MLIGCLVSIRLRWFGCSSFSLRIQFIEVVVCQWVQLRVVDGEFSVCELCSVQSVHVWICSVWSIDNVDGGMVSGPFINYLLTTVDQCTASSSFQSLLRLVACSVFKLCVFSLRLVYFSIYDFV